jgi:hypothetical protein
MSALWHSWQAGCIYPNLLRKYETVVLERVVDGQEFLVAIKVGDNTPVCTFEDFARECIEPHPKECLFHPEAVELTQEAFPETRNCPIHILPWKVFTEATSKLGSFEIYCLIENIDRRVQFGLI